MNEWTFTELMNQFEVRIPLIQRDYVQGRPNEFSIRSAFVTSIAAVLNAALKSGPERLTLDFVYGVSDTNKKWFKPLDGQQRLTTLTLVYWYFGAINKSWRFVYESRRMACRFVKALFELKFDGSTEPSKWIRKQSCIVPVWLKDPTVSGMLVMLDQIHASAAAIRGEIKQKNLDDRISFFCHFCDAAIPPDETYLKINARGEPLTRWENIKAILDERVSKILDPHCKSNDPCIVKAAEVWRDSINGVWEECIERILPEMPIEDNECLIDPERHNSDNQYYIALSVDLMNTAFANIVDLAAMISMTIDGVRAWAGNERVRRNGDFDETQYGFMMLGARQGISSVYDENGLLAYMVEAFHEHKAEYEDYRDPRILSDAFFVIIASLFDGLQEKRWDLISTSWTTDRKKSRLWQNLICTRDECSDTKEILKDFLFSGLSPRGNSLPNDNMRNHFEEWIKSKNLTAYYKGDLFKYSDGIRYTLLCNHQDAFLTTRVLNVLEYLDVSHWDRSFGQNCRALLCAQRSGIGAIKQEGAFSDLRSKDLISKVILDEEKKCNLYREGKQTFIGIEFRRGLFKGMIKFAYDGEIGDYSEEREKFFVEKFLIDERPSQNEGYLGLLAQVDMGVGCMWLPQAFGYTEKATKEWRWFLYEDAAYEAYTHYVRGRNPINATWFSHYKQLIMERHRPYSRIERHWCKWGGRARMFAYDGTSYISKNAVCIEYEPQQIGRLRALLGGKSYLVNFDDIQGDEIVWRNVCNAMKGES